MGGLTEGPNLGQKPHSKQQKIKVVERVHITRHVEIASGKKQTVSSECRKGVSSLMTRNDQTSGISQKVQCLHFLVPIVDEERILTLKRKGSAVLKNAHAEKRPQALRSKWKQMAADFMFCKCDKSFETAHLTYFVIKWLNERCSLT